MRQPPAPAVCGPYNLAALRLSLSDNRVEISGNHPTLCIVMLVTIRCAIPRTSYRTNLTTTAEHE
jgi:hypothetical protein